MFTKSTIALAIIVGLASSALAANEPQHNGANVYGSSRSIDDFCRQPGPITMPAKHPICNTKDFMQR